MGYPDLDKPRQLSFDGFDQLAPKWKLASPAKPMAHGRLLFFVLRLSPAETLKVEEQSAWVRRVYGLRSRPTPPERLHLTVQLVYWSADPPPQNIVDAARRAASTVSAAPFPLALDRIQSFGGTENKRSLVLSGKKSAPLTAFQRKLVVALNSAGLRLRADSLTPHVTMFRDQAIQPVDIEPIVLMVKDFVLIDSHWGYSHHEELGRWTLKE